MTFTSFPHLFFTIALGKTSPQVNGVQMKSQKTNWWLDAVLYAGFLATFFLNITGVEIHQWIGLIIGFLVLLHLVLHIDWVTMATTKFFDKLPNSARLNLVLDAGIGVGFFSIIFTGIVMSTWLNLAIANYSAWSTIHTLLSVFTLFVLVFKLILHRKWIVCTAEKYIFHRDPRKAPVSSGIPVAAIGRINRREFLKVGALAGAGAVIGIVQFHNILEETLVQKTTSNPILNSATVGATSTDPQTVQHTAANEYQASTISPAQPTAIPITSQADNQSATDCQVQCSRGCSFPGRCRRYADSNGNGKCDRGECA
jgi:hypothetical protein